MTEKGNLSINSENILPIIKKWLYSDTDIFVREMVSNGCDAITKLQRLNLMGEEIFGETEKYFIKVVCDKKRKTLKFTDNGIGMTAEEIKQYINQIAFSGANDFIEKYRDKIDAGSEIIGHFGLGFYSAFMVSDKVQIDSLSYKPGEAAARWVCEGGIDYELSDSGKADRGTEITLYLNDEGKDFADEFKMRSVLKKYCGFMPVEIFVEDVEEKKKEEREKKKEEKKRQKDRDKGKDIVATDGEVDTEDEPESTAPAPINETNPLWLKKPADCTDEDYKSFYHKVFTDFNDPLFWIHLNMDYPFRLKGILYFPKLKHELESIEGQVKLYNNQVFIADNIKEVIPEFLLLLKGVMDCPDLPLNVSRSFLQNDGYVAKMSKYIIKKVADKLNSLFKDDRENYDKFWEDINQFIKYGCIREKDFYDKVKGSVVYKTTGGEYLSLSEFIGKNEPKTGKKVFYVTNEQQQAQYIKLFREQGAEAVILTTRLDNPFVSYVETYESGVEFARIDSDISGTLKDDAPDGDKNEDTAKETETLEKFFRDSIGDEKLKIKVEGLKSGSVPAVMLLSEQSRRMQEMSRMFGDGFGMGMLENEETLVLNRNNALIKSLLAKNGDGADEDTKTVCRQIYDLAILGHKPLDADGMNDFIERSARILEKYL